MKIPKDKINSSSWAQSKYGEEVIKDSIMINGKDASNFNDRGKGLKFILDRMSKSPRLFKDKNNLRSGTKFYYKPKKEIGLMGNSLNARDAGGAPNAIGYRSTRRDSAKKAYKGLLRDIKDSLKKAGYTDKEAYLDKEMREAIKKEIRKKEKIQVAKNVSKVAIPTIAIAGLAYNKYKNKSNK